MGRVLCGFPLPVTGHSYIISCNKEFKTKVFPVLYSTSTCTDCVSGYYITVGQPLGHLYEPLIGNGPVDDPVGMDVFEGAISHNLELEGEILAHHTQ